MKQFTVVFNYVGDCPVWSEGACMHPRTKKGYCYGVGTCPIPPNCPCKDVPPDILEAPADSAKICPEIIESNTIKGLSKNPAEAYQQGRRDGRAEAEHAAELAGS